VANSNSLIIYVCVEVIQVLEEEEYTFSSRTCWWVIHSEKRPPSAMAHCQTLQPLSCVIIATLKAMMAMLMMKEKESSIRFDLSLSINLTWSDLSAAFVLITKPINSMLWRLTTLKWPALWTRALLETRQLLEEHCTSVDHVRIFCCWCYIVVLDVIGWSIDVLDCDEL